MKNKKLFILFIIALFFSVSKVNAASTTTLCKYNGMSFDKNGLTNFVNGIEKGIDIIKLLQGKDSGSFNMSIVPQLNTNGYLYDIEFSNSTLTRVLNRKPVIAGTSTTLSALEYTDSWRVNKINTTASIKYSTEKPQDMISYGECPSYVLIYVHYEPYEVAGLVAGAVSGNELGKAATVTFCGAAPLVGLDPATCALVFGSTVKKIGTVAGAYKAYKVGEKFKKWVIDDMVFLNQPKEVNILSFLPGAFDTFTDPQVLFGYLKETHFAKTAKYNSFNSNACLDSSGVNYYNKLFNDIINYSKNTSYITLYKNNKFEHIATIISKQYAKGGECYNKNESLQKSYITLSDNAKKVLKIFDAASKSNQKYKNECQYILGDPTSKGSFAYYLDITFRFIKFIVPLLFIVLTIIDYIKVIASDDTDQINKINKKTVIRLIFTLLLFFLPTLISTILTMMGVQGRCDFPNISGL